MESNICCKSHNFCLPLLHSFVFWSFKRAGEQYERVAKKVAAFFLSPKAKDCSCMSEALVVLFQIILIKNCRWFSRLKRLLKSCSQSLTRVQANTCSIKSFPRCDFFFVFFLHQKCALNELEKSVKKSAMVPNFLFSFFYHRSTNSIFLISIALRIPVRPIGGF